MNIFDTYVHIQKYIMYIYIYIQKGTPWQCSFCTVFYTCFFHIHSSVTTHNFLQLYLAHVQWPPKPKKQKNKKPKKNKKKQDCTPQPSASDPLPLGCAILFFLGFCFFLFLVWVINAHVPSRIARHC